METVKASLTQYVVDAKASRFTVQAFATGLLSSMGHNPTIGIRNFSGSVSFSRETLQATELRLSIKAASLSVQDDVTDRDRREIERLMNEQVLETAKYAEIIYEAPIVSIIKLGDSLYSADFDGNLTLRGITSREPATARIAAFGIMLRASGDLTMRQTTFGIKLISVAGGSIKLKDELKLSFEMVMREQE